MNNIAMKVKDIIDIAYRMKNAYFFQPPKQASARRSYEKYYSRDLVEWTDGKDVYTAKFTVSCSCQNVYAKGEYTKNGNPTTLTAIRNSYNRISNGGLNI